MSDATGARLPSWSDRARRLLDELYRMFRLRRELAELEIRHDYRTLRRLLLVGGTGVGLALIGLPLLVTGAAHGLAAVTVLGFVEWILILGTAFTVPGLVVSVLAIRSFRAEFSGLRSTLAELNEDMIWLREWSRRADSERDEEPEA